jgi:hypothetical protein
MGSGEHLVECGTLRLGAADSVGVLVDDFKTALLCQPPQIKRLGLGILIESGNSGVENGSLHRVRSSVQG